MIAFTKSGRDFLLFDLHTFLGKISNLHLDVHFDLDFQISLLYHVYLYIMVFEITTTKTNLWPARHARPLKSLHCWKWYRYLQAGDGGTAIPLKHGCWTLKPTLRMLFLEVPPVKPATSGCQPLGFWMPKYGKKWSYVAIQITVKTPHWLHKSQISSSALQFPLHLLIDGTLSTLLWRTAEVVSSQGNSTSDTEIPIPLKNIIIF